ncbi:hypothetical protein DERP_008108 [Dermatophagoides pteronyssinus]|uniref:Uncharacterized protein n=1 Tax=Dermatophagoides pteronyssinus TaxID=6956 RepID=A0ABQ8JKC4_DERPT|nr:hypothetical protein DERP_008108 [Dermatophagoides pteronyssinus]
MSTIQEQMNQNTHPTNRRLFRRLHLIILLLILIDLTFSSKIPSNRPKTNDRRLVKKSHVTVRQLSEKYDHFVKLKPKKSFKNTQTRKRKGTKLRKSRQNLNENVESSNEAKDNSTIEKLLNRESEIRVPLPLPSGEIPSSLPIIDDTNISNIELAFANNLSLKECSNDTLVKDLGVSCLKKSMDMTPPANMDGRNAISRHFSVSPMINRKINTSNQFKTPADNARSKYALNGYRDQIKPLRRPPKVQTRFQPTSENDPSRQEISTPLFPTNRNPFLSNVPKIELDPKIKEDLELLNSLKLNLGVLNAQASNIKQRTKLLYGEAKRRKMIFFDRLLLRTNSIITEKRDKTSRTIDTIDVTMNRMRKQQTIKAYNKYRRNMRLMDQNFDRYPNGMLKPLPKVPEINQTQIDQLVTDCENHSKQMMEVIRELNEALDEFEVQFNFPRFEPNSIIDEYLKDVEL